jgi:putative DeoR family transcriptional regulator, stage III sporulation protein D
VKNFERVKNFANYIVENNATIRQTASVFGYSKSTVHNDIQKKLKKTDNKLFEKVKIILQNNFLEKHIRGGMSTKQKYLKIKQK